MASKNKFIDESVAPVLVSQLTDVVKIINSHSIWPQFLLVQSWFRYLAHSTTRMTQVGYSIHGLDLESFFSCFRRCFGVTDGNFDNDRLHNSFNTVAVTEHLLPTVSLDTYKIGDEVVIVKNGHRICGTGAALANTPIQQNKAYFEVTIQQSGTFGIGLATSHVDLNHIPLGHDEHSWVLRNDGSIFHKNTQVYKLPDQLKIGEGDVIGVTYDHIEMKYLINNQVIDHPVTGVRGGGDVGLYPLVYVDDGAILDTSFTTFTYPPPPGFDRILAEKTLL